jgi:glycosyltransferase involved in cell wall biosynthesis
MNIAFIATYPPEQCGIATFTQNLLLSVKKNFDSKSDSIKVIALQKEDCPEYDKEVVFTIRQHIKEDYIAAAEFINHGGFDICIIQHEYGIFGGDSGMYILSLARRLSIPFIVTAHTVLKRPSLQQQSIMRALSEKGEQIVVMTNKARQFLRDIYNIDVEKISIIEHGVPKKTNVNAEVIKKKMNLEGKTLMMTFGLLGRNKGIETVIKALPAVVAKHPDVVYLVQGNTHPAVLRNEGESYRDSLLALSEESGVADHVIFRKGFMTEDDLFELLHSVDIYITPYQNEEQITSGTLSYALGAGTVVLSTPYWHAQELLAGNRGWLFNFRDHDQLAMMINELLDHPSTMEELRTNATHYAHHLRWSNAGKRYLGLIKNILKQEKETAHIHTVPYFAEPGLRHVIKLTDNIGIYQHALFGLPNYHEGYCLDDNARALLAMNMAAEQGFKNETSSLAEVYLTFIHFMQQKNGWFHNFLSFERRIIDEECSEDAYGRTMWALGKLISSDAFPSLQSPAEEIFLKALPHVHNLHYTRGISNTLIGISFFLEKNPSHSEANEMHHMLSGRMMDFYQRHNDGTWNWFENTLTYDNGILPLSLLKAYQVNGDENVLKTAREATSFLERELMGNDYLSLVGSNGWYVKGRTKNNYPQQAIDAMSMCLLFSEWMRVEPNSRYRELLMKCYRWFFFENDLGISLYDRNTQGCCDGLEDYGINKNQGAESTLAAFISHYAMRNVVEEDALDAEEVGSKETD